MITFDWTMQDDEVGDELPMLPNGKHVAKINYVRLKQADWCKSSRNEAGNYLLLGIDVNGYQRIWDSIPVDKKARIQAVCLAAKVALPKPNEEWDELSLIGEFVTLNSESRTSNKSGREYVAIKGYDTRPENKKPVAKSRAVKKKEEEVDVAPDDIPF